MGECKWIKENADEIADFVESNPEADYPTEAMTPEGSDSFSRERRNEVVERLRRLARSDDD